MFWTEALEHQLWCSLGTSSLDSMGCALFEGKLDTRQYRRAGYNTWNIFHVNNPVPTSVVTLPVHVVGLAPCFGGSMRRMQGTTDKKAVHSSTAHFAVRNENESANIHEISIISHNLGQWCYNFRVSDTIGLPYEHAADTLRV